MDSLLPSRWRESQSEKILQGITSYTGKVRGLAPSHLFIPPHCLHEAGLAFNISDKNWRSLKLQGGNHWEAGQKQAMHRLCEALDIRIHCGLYPLSSETPWKTLNMVVYLLALSYIHSSHSYRIPTLCQAVWDWSIWKLCIWRVSQEQELWSTESSEEVGKGIAAVDIFGSAI